MRILISLGVLILVFLIGVKTEWIAVSRAEPTTSEDRAYQAVVLGQAGPNATSGELIDAAVSRGEISIEQGLLYGVYLACGDARLPAHLSGQDATPPARNILWEAHVDWPALSPDIQQALSTLFNTAPATGGGLACAEELERLKGDSTVWWAPALEGQPVPARLANTP